MPLVKTITAEDLRGTNDYSYEAWKAIVDYYEEFEESIELDIIALRCEWCEYESLEDIKKDYDEIETIEDLQDRTYAVELSNGNILFSVF
jgi:hypothetical protein